MKNCFVISPIGKSASDTRIRADKILKYVIKPVCTKLGINAYRADEINDPGLITKRIIQEIITSELVVADLTGHNPNVFYELAIRHFIGKPIVQLIEANDKLPFDVYDINTIKIDHRDISSIENAKDKLRLYIDSVMQSGKTDTPVTAVLNSMGISLNVGRDKTSLEEQLLILTKQVVSELEQSKEERSLLIKKLVEHTTGKRTFHINDRKPSSIDGLWHSNNGNVLLSQTDDFIVGEYQYHGDIFGGAYIGEIIGKLVGNVIIFEWNWKDGSTEGLGYWYVGKQEMNGAWLYKDESNLTLNDLIENPSLIDTLRRTKENEWLLYRTS